MTRILPAINYKALAKAIEKGTQFVGQSDFTALQMALLAKTRAVTWAGPALGEDFGTEQTPDDIMEACFDDLVSGQGEGAGWQLPKNKPLNAIDSGAACARIDWSKGQFDIKNATLWGGNLAVLASLI